MKATTNATVTTYERINALLEKEKDITIEIY